MELFVISSILLWIIVLLNLFLTLALVRRINMSSTEKPMKVETLPIGQTAPDFAAETMQKKTVTLANYAGHPLALVFISPTCGHCRPLIPQLQNLGIKAKESGTELIFVSDASVDETQAYAQELNITLPVLSAPRQNSSFFTDYKAFGVPDYVLIDAQGKVRDSGHPGNLSWEIISSNLGKEGIMI